MGARRSKSVKPAAIREIAAWEKQNEESGPAFQAFVVYRDQGLGNRSTARVSEALGKSVVLMHRWSRRWQWVSRVDAYDRFLDDQMRDRHLRELYEAKDRHANLARLMQSKFLERLRDVPADQLPLAILAPMLKVATDVELRALGESTLKVETELTGARGGPITLSIDELAQALYANGEHDNSAESHILKDSTQEPQEP
jgi:hypothetical protein